MTKLIQAIRSLFAPKVRYVCSICHKPVDTFSEAACSSFYGACSHAEVQA